MANILSLAPVIGALLFIWQSGINALTENTHLHHWDICLWVHQCHLRKYCQLKGQSCKCFVDINKPDMFLFLFTIWLFSTSHLDLTGIDIDYLIGLAKYLSSTRRLNNIVLTQKALETHWGFYTGPLPTPQQLAENNSIYCKLNVKGLV